MSHPLDERVISEVRFVTGLEVSPYAAVRSALASAITAAYDRQASGEVLLRGKAGPPTPHLEVLVPPPGEQEEEEEEAIEIVDELDFAEAGQEGEQIAELQKLPLPLRSDGRPLALVVDDEPEIRHLVQRMLESRGYAVETAADGEEALLLAEAVVPDVVLLDAMLPKKSMASRRASGSSRPRAPATCRW